MTHLYAVHRRHLRFKDTKWFQSERMEKGTPKCNPRQCEVGILIADKIDFKTIAGKG